VNSVGDICAAGPSTIVLSLPNGNIVEQVLGQKEYSSTK
jgi:hypothetical protein